MPFDPALTGSSAGLADKSHSDAPVNGRLEGVALRPLSREGVISHSSSPPLLCGVPSHSPRFPSLLSSRSRLLCLSLHNLTFDFDDFLNIHFLMLLRFPGKSSHT